MTSFLATWRRGGVEDEVDKDAGGRRHRGGRGRRRTREEEDRRRRTMRSRA